MKNFAIGFAASAVLVGSVFALSSCSTVTTALSSPTGQLFCALDEGASGQIVIGVIDAAASAYSAGPIAVLATNATQSYVQAACAAAAVSAGAKAGIPVSPPVTVVSNVAVVTAKLPAGAASK